MPDAPRVGDAVVIDGKKYRIREVLSQTEYYLSAVPKRITTHYVDLEKPLAWDNSVGVFRPDGLKAFWKVEKRGTLGYQVVGLE